MPHPRATWLDGATLAPLETGALLRELATQDVVLLGERHDVHEIHRWQAHVIAALHVLRPDLMVGFEMFPRRVQPALDAWVDGALTTDAFLEAAEWATVWNMPADLYLPIFHLCRQQRIPMLGLNCRRDLVSAVGRDGWDAIAEPERDGVTPARRAPPAHRRWLFELTGGAGAGRGSGAESADDPRFDRFVRAQQVWDRAFACRIADARTAALAAGHPPPLIVGVIGSGHMEFGFGTPDQLADLGIDRCAGLLTTTAAEHPADAPRGRARALYRIDEPEPPAALPQRSPRT